MAKLPFADGLSPHQYTHRLLLAILRRGQIILTQDEISGVSADDSLIVENGNTSREITIRVGPRNTEIVFIDPPKDDKWQTPILPSTPDPSPQIPSNNLVNSTASSPTPRIPYQPLPQTPQAPKDKMDPLGRPVSAQPDQSSRRDAEQENVEIPLRDELEMAPESEEELQAMEETMEEIYREPDPQLPTSPLEEIQESQEQIVQPRKSPSTRRAVLDDMNLFLKEKKMLDKQDRKAKQADMILKNRDGLLPFKVNKSR